MSTTLANRLDFETASSRKGRLLRSIIPIGLFIIVWHFAALAINLTLLVPPPSLVFTEFLRVQHLIWRNLAATLSVTAAAYVGGILSATVVGIALNIDERYRDALMPIVVSTNSFPRLVLAPLFIFYLGGFTAKFTLAIWIAFFPIAINTIEGFSIQNDEMEALLNSLNATAWQKFKYVRVYNALPFIFDGMKIGITLAFVGALVAEFVAGTGKGIGIMAFQALRRYQTETLIALIIVTSILAVLGFFAVYYLQDRIVFWKTASLFVGQEAEE